MMKMNSKISTLLTTGTAAAIVAALLLSSPNYNNCVDAAAWNSQTVTCLQESPTICVGSATFITPSIVTCPNDEDDASITNCYEVGSSWTYDFMTGLENYNGTDLMDIDPDVTAQADETGLEVTVSIDEDGICIIDVGNETCSTCSTCTIDNCDGDYNPTNNTTPTTIVSFDCTNVPNGRASAICEPLPYNEGGLYPLLFPSNEQMLQEDNESTLDDNSSDGIDRHLEEGTGPVLTPAADTGTTYGSSSSGGNSGTDTCPVKITLDSEGGPMGNGRCFGVGAGCAYKKNYRKYAQCNCVQQGRKRPKWQCFPDPSTDDSDMLKD